MVISKTPLRMSFFGGGTDFRGYYEHCECGYGTVLSTAIDMYVYIMACKRFDDKIRVCYTKNEFVDTVEQVEHNIVREAMKIVGVEKGIDIVYSADIPLSSAGVGLASSSALAVGVLNALYAYKGIHASAELLAQKACEIEIERLGNPIGKQDQYAVAYGGLRQYRFYANEQVSSEVMLMRGKKFRELKDALMLFYTGITRVSSEILKEQEEHIVNKMVVLDEMVGLTEYAIAQLKENQYDEWGEMLDKGWELKKQMANRITNPVIEEMYQNAKIAGAVGGKILGAGGGGFLLLYVPPERKQAVRSVLGEYKEVAFEFEPEGSKIIFIE